MDDPQFRSADGSAIRIWTDTAKNPFASEREGRPIYDECIYVEVIAPGSKGSTPVFEVERIFNETVGISTPYHSPQYAQYEDQITAYKSKVHNENVSGTPLKEWPEISRTMAASLKEAGVYSVEALAALPDGRLNVVGPDGRTWRTKAQVWLDSTKDSGVATALAAQLELARGDIAQRDQQIAELAQRLSALEGQGTSQGGQGGASQPAPATTLAAAPAPVPVTPAAKPGKATVAAPAPLPAVETLAATAAPGDTLVAAKPLGDIV